jgi:hypothetical protein
MMQLQFNRSLRLFYGIVFLLTATGCASKQDAETSLVDAISKAVGFTLPADAAILAYHHQHDDKENSQCSQLWIVRASVLFAGPDRRISQNHAKSPFKSLKTLVEQATGGKVVIEAADGTACECVEWKHGKTMCRLRQAQTRNGWVAALEAIAQE